MQRGYDQIIHDAAIAKLPLRLLIDRAGIVGEDGETHQGLFDVSFLSSIPNVTIYSPASFSELEGVLLDSLSDNGVVAIRYPRGGESLDNKFNYTKNEYDWFFEGNKKLIVSYGRISENAYKAAEILGDTTFLKLNKVYPFCDKLLDKMLEFNEIYFFEEGIKSGGISEKLSSKLSEKGFGGKIKIFAVDNCFVPCASVEASLKNFKLDTSSMVEILGGSV